MKNTWNRGFKMKNTGNTSFKIKTFGREEKKKIFETDAAK
jgi:hypothetical protein